ncbi:lipocalin family protein [Aequorivita capsosiphonis]|uniref:lipocalin family protein n=1 Tax=Aequorivita capsosiphonis TaxID=487317 RepID=UPI0003F59533|nr:lipocalin family protein [Aequorivita capsosiphonis]
MKKLAFLFLLMFLAYSVQSQSLTDKEITGTWQVVSIVDAGAQPKQAEDMIAAYFDIYPDHNFQLRLKRKSKASNEYDNTFKNSTWSFNEATQTIELSNSEMKIKPIKSDNKMIFELPETGIKLAVVMPI